jgi:LysM repeat protein
LDGDPGHGYNRNVAPCLPTTSRSPLNVRVYRARAAFGRPRPLAATVGAALAWALLTALVCAGCRGPGSSPSPPKLPLDVTAMARRVPEGPRRDASREEWKREGRQFARRLFSRNPMPKGMPSREDDVALRGQRLLETLEKQRALESRMHPAPPAWSAGVPRPPERTAKDVPRQWRVSVKRGETLELLAKWSRSDKKELWQDNRDVLPRRKWLRPGDRLMVTASPNQKLAFDQGRERFHNRRLERYFATRYIEKVVKYRVKRGDYISKVAKRYGDVPTWLLEAFNQTDFKTIRPGDTVLIPLIAKAERGEQPKTALRVTDERGRPLNPEERARLQNHARMDLLNRARLSMDDSNVFERENEAQRPMYEAVPTGFASQWSTVLPKGLASPVETISEDVPRVQVLAHAPAPGDGSGARRPITVRLGETIGHYASWSGLTVAQIEGGNPDLNADRIRIGQRLELPLGDEDWVNFVLARAKKSKASRGTKLAAAASRLEEIQTARALKALEMKKLPAVIGAGAKAKAVAAVRPAPGPIRAHVVQSGDIGSRIAKKYGVTFKQLVRANPDKNLDRIRPGQTLKVPGARR